MARYQYLGSSSTHYFVRKPEKNGGDKDGCATIIAACIFILALIGFASLFHN